jgi:hypothetical protein
MPSFGTCSFRLENERTTKHWYAARNLSVFPGTDQATSGFFSRARAINTAARAAYRTSPERDIYVLADNDLIPSVPHLVEALAAADSYSAITPHLTTLHTSHAGREHLLNGKTTFLYRPKESGSKSYVVIRREVFAHINGMDELFEGWGPEDKELCARLEHAGLQRQTLAAGGIACHLHHAPAARDRRAINESMFETTVASRATRCALWCCCLRVSWPTRSPNKSRCTPSTPSCAARWCLAAWT